MILIYEESDIAKDRDTIQIEILSWTDIEPELRGVAAIADTVYVSKCGESRMVKARNGPLDPYRLKIEVKRAI